MHDQQVNITLLLFPSFHCTGLLLGVVQMAVWLLWDPWWSLALGGAAVGYLTDWFALKVSPITVKVR
jgi:hypothetical protein